MDSFVIGGGEIGRSIAEGLRAEGHRVEEHAGGEQLLADPDVAWPPLVVVSRLDEAGLSLTRALQDARADSVTVLMVVRQDEQDRLDSIMEAGADDYIIVPLHPVRIRARVRLTARKAEEKARWSRARRDLAARASQQALVAELGQRALSGERLQNTLDFAAQSVATALEVEFSKVLEYDDGTDRLLLRAGTGWREGLIGTATVEAGAGTRARFTLVSRVPVITEDPSRETRFSAPQLLREHGVQSGISVVIAGESGRYGILGAHTRSRRGFTRDDLHFMQSVANLLAAVYERRAAERTLRRNQLLTARLAAVAARTINGVIITGPDRTIEWVNEGFTRITGYALDEVRGKKPGFILQGVDSDPATIRAIGGHLARQEGFTTEILNYRKTGEPYWVRIEVQPLTDADGALSGYMGIETDITEARASEQALRESEAKARAIVDTTVDGIITTDRNGLIESYNEAAERIFGFRPGEAIGQNVKMLMPSPYFEEHDAYMAAYHATGRRKIIGIGREVVGQRKDGSTFPMELAVSEVSLGPRTIFTGIIRDITDRRRLEQEILEISEQERRRIGQDLHDGLGQMLTGIGLINKSVERTLRAAEHPAAEAVAEVTDLIKEADQHARGLARGLVPVELDAGGLATALHRLTANAERFFGITCRFEETGTVRVHDNTAATHLYRIAQESVSNAVKHGRASRVVVTLGTERDHIRLRIQDDGIGFPDALGENVGMGVRIMHYRARIIGATLDVRRDPSGGTVVSCQLPPTSLTATQTIQAHQLHSSAS